jgi:Tfp pilus assembly protein PilX
MSLEKELQKTISNQMKKIEELLVVIDTAQAALRRAESTIVDENDKKHVFNQSAKWVLAFKASDID